MTDVNKTCLCFQKIFDIVSMEKNLLLKKIGSTRYLGMLLVSLGLTWGTQATAEANPYVFWTEVPEKDYQSHAPASLVDVTVTGTVIDKDGMPIPGVTVLVKGTTIGTATDLEGRYSISVPEGSTLVFSFIGFESRAMVVGDQTVINITLAEDISSLDEGVVVG